MICTQLVSYEVFYLTIRHRYFRHNIHRLQFLEQQLRGVRQLQRGQFIVDANVLAVIALSRVRQQTAGLRVQI